MWEGTVVSIHIAREAAATMQSIAEVRALPGSGLEGDRILLGRATIRRHRAMEGAKSR